MMTNTLLALTLTLAASSFALGQTANNSSIESRLKELRVEKSRTLTSYVMMASHVRSRLSWETHMETLGNIKQSVNRSAAIIRGLESERNTMSAAQQARFDELKSQTAQLASATNTLINQIKERTQVTQTAAFERAVDDAYRHALGSRQAVRDLIALSSQASAMPAGN